MARLDDLKIEFLDASRALKAFVGCSSKSTAFQRARQRERDAERALLAAGFAGGTVDDPRDASNG